MVIADDVTFTNFLYNILNSGRDLIINFKTKMHLLLHSLIILCRGFFIAICGIINGTVGRRYAAFFFPRVARDFFIQQKGCIDLTSAMDDFTKWFTTNKKDLIIKVKYE